MSKLTVDRIEAEVLVGATVLQASEVAGNASTSEAAKELVYGR